MNVTSSSLVRNESDMLDQVVQHRHPINMNQQVRGICTPLADCQEKGQKNVEG